MCIKGVLQSKRSFQFLLMLHDSGTAQGSTTYVSSKLLNNNSLTKMHIQLIFISICIMYLACSNAIPCDSCGKECASACGTKHFRTCCFNYLRKRTDPDALRLSSNKRLIDFILLQGRALFTQELRERRNNGTLIDLDLNTYYG